MPFERYRDGHRLSSARCRQKPLLGKRLAGCIVEAGLKPVNDLDIVDSASAIDDAP